MRVIILKPGEKAYVDEIENTLKKMQNIVGGYIECINPWGNKIVMVCNDEGKIAGLPMNIAINTDWCKDVICGTVFFCREKGPELTDLTDEDVEFLLDAIC